MDKPFISVRWYDAEDFGDAGWATEELLAEWGARPCESLSYGYLVSQNRSYITLAADCILPGTYGRIMKIPKRMIQEMKEIDLSTAITYDTVSSRKRSTKRSTTSEPTSHTEPATGAGENSIQDPDLIS